MEVTLTLTEAQALDLCRAACKLACQDIDAGLRLAPLVSQLYDAFGWEVEEENGRGMFSRSPAVK
jgi:hypothetical protein